MISTTPRIIRAGVTYPERYYKMQLPNRDTVEEIRDAAQELLDAIENIEELTDNLKGAILNLD